jgi:hypothetical protein
MTAMAQVPTPRKTLRKPAVPRTLRKAAPAAPAPAAPAPEAETIVATAQDALARLREQVADTLRAAQQAADQAARELPARLDEHLKAAEAESGKLAEAAASRMLAQVKAAEEAAAKVPELIASQIRSAEAAVAKALDQLDSRVAEGISNAGAAADKAGRQVSDQIDAAAAALAGLREQAETSLRSIEGAAQQVSSAQRNALAGAGAAGSMMMEGMAQAQKGVTDFVSARIRNDIDTQRALLGCRSLEDVRDVQSRFFRNAMTQYSEELARLMKLGSEVTQRALDRSKG